MRVTERAARYLWASQLVAGRDVLDAGCGAGHGSRILAEAGGGHVIGVDSSPAAIGRAEGAIDGPTDFVLADLASLPFTDGSFDVVVCFDPIDAIDAIDGSAQAAAIVGELRRVLRADGQLLISLAGGLERLLRGQFAEVSVYSQHPCHGSLVRPADRADEPPPDGRMQILTRRLAGDDPAETRALALASVTGPAPSLEPIAVVGSLVGLRGSPGSLDAAPRADGLLADGLVADGVAGGLVVGGFGGSGVEARLALLTRRLVEAETENARIPELERYLQACECEVRKFESSVLGRIGKAIYHIRAAFR